MEIKQEFPPNISEIVKTFDIHGLNPVFTYGDVLYNPTGGEISDDLMTHEETHAKQQRDFGKEDWWTRYLIDPTFRMMQEVEAYREQYKHIERTCNRAERRWYLEEFAKNLSSRLYGNIIKKKQAQELIKNYA